MKPWRVIMEPSKAGEPLIIVETYIGPRARDAAAGHAQRLAETFRFAGEERPRILVQTQGSSDQLQTFQHGTRAVRDQADKPARGQHVTILAPTARPAQPARALRPKAGA